MSQAIKLSIIVPTLNREAPLRKTLEGLLEQLTEEMELIVVDQSEHHEERTHKVLKNQRIKLLNVSEKSAAAARNLGIQKAQAPILLILDDDIEPAADFLLNHLKNYEDPTVGGVVGYTETPSEPTPDYPFHNKVTFYGRLKGNPTFSSRTDTIGGGSNNLSCRSEVARQIHGFDRSFIGNDKWSDFDFCYRLRSTGKRLVYDPSAKMLHLRHLGGGARSAEGWQRYYYETYHNDALFFWRHLHRIFLPVYLLGQVVKIVKLASGGPAPFPLPTKDRPATAGILFISLVKGTISGVVASQKVRGITQ